MITFGPDASRAGVARPGEAPIDGQLVCHYPCPRCSNPARAPVYLGDAALAQEIVARPSTSPSGARTSAAAWWPRARRR